MTMREVIEGRSCCVEGVLKCYPHETLETIIDRIAEAEVNQLYISKSKVAFQTAHFHKINSTEILVSLRICSLFGHIVYFWQGLLSI